MNFNESFLRLSSQEPLNSFELFLRDEAFVEHDGRRPLQSVRDEAITMRFYRSTYSIP